MTELRQALTGNGLKIVGKVQQSGLERIAM